MHARILPSQVKPLGSLAEPECFFEIHIGCSVDFAAIMAIQQCTTPKVPAVLTIVPSHTLTKNVKKLILMVWHLSILSQWMR
jgi:hypothetical protein